MAPREAFHVKMGVGSAPVAPLAGDSSSGAAGAPVGMIEFTKAFSRLKAFTLPMPVAKSQPGTAAYAGSNDVFEVDSRPSPFPAV